MEDIMPYLAVVSGLVSVSGLLVTAFSNNVIKKTLETIKMNEILVDKVDDVTELRAVSAKLQEPLYETENAVIQIGSLLLVKRKMDNKSEIITRSLTSEQMALLARKSSLLQNPEKLILELEELEDDNELFDKPNLVLRQITPNETIQQKPKSGAADGLG